MKLTDFLKAYAVRGACTCGRCIDAPENPEEHQPKGHTADVMFFKVALVGEPDVEAFREIVERDYPRWLDGEEHSYLEMGADVGDQGTALMTMGVGHLLGVWELLTPRNVFHHLPEDMQMQMAGMGMVAIKVKRE